MKPKQTIPVLGFCAHSSGSGKTTLLTQLIPDLIARGLRISIIKHAHHSFEIDHAGKDSYRLREAGAVQMMIGSKDRWALMTELSRTPYAKDEPNLTLLLSQIDTSLSDLVLVEGFKDEAIPKIAVYRRIMGKPLLADNDIHIIAVATDEVVNTAKPQINLNDISAVANFIYDWLKLQH